MSKISKIPSSLQVNIKFSFFPKVTQSVILQFEKNIRFILFENILKIISKFFSFDRFLEKLQSFLLFILL